MEEILIDLHVKKLIHTTNGDELLELKLTIPRFGFITFFGKSGVGKTTLLRMIAGLTNPDSGYIKVNNEIWFDSDKKINIKPQQRNIGFVFQDYALFPNMTVKEHLLYAQFYKERGYVSELLEIFHLKGLCERKPAKLSGGQQQRLAVARALARKPQILLLDEPLSALDNETRTILQDEILLAHEKFSATTLLVSHDINEVVKLSDYIYVIENGEINKQGCPKEIFNNTKFQVLAQVLKIEGTILTISANDTITKIEVSEFEIRDLKVNDKILIPTKIVNPMILRINTS
ncbi:MAG: ATP-binding cassette domain-containing protein [Bacteroidales bacterium]|nr:MAG: ATP-binding cassette domain-containing protein [Bacteroidales bacterium]